MNETTLVVEFPPTAEVGKRVTCLVCVTGPIVAAPTIEVRITPPGGEGEEQEFTSRLEGSDWVASINFTPSMAGEYKFRVSCQNLQREVVVKAVLAAESKSAEQSEEGAAAKPEDGDAPAEGWHPPLTVGVSDEERDPPKPVQPADEGHDQPTNQEEKFFAPGDQLKPVQPAEEPAGEEKPSLLDRYPWPLWIGMFLLIGVLGVVVFLVSVDYMGGLKVTMPNRAATSSPVAMGDSNPAATKTDPAVMSGLQSISLIVSPPASATVQSAASGASDNTYAPVMVPDGNGGFRQVLVTSDGKQQSGYIDVIARQENLAKAVESLKNEFDEFKADIAKAATASKQAAKAKAPAKKDAPSLAKLKAYSVYTVALESGVETYTFIGEPVPGGLYYQRTVEGNNILIPREDGATVTSIAEFLAWGEKK